MITGKQRAYLKSLANGLEASVYIGKNELTDSILKEIDDYLNAHEIIKVKLQESVIAGAKEIANIACERLDAEYVQAIGRKFVLYRPSKDKPEIVLPK